MSHSRSVAIFWDYENCAITPAKSHAVANNILNIARASGTVVIFNAYSEWANQKPAKTHDLRLILPSCGVSLVDCPHNGQKNAADTVILADMMVFVSDNPAPATIVLISGDGDFTGAVKELRGRTYDVVIFAPTSTAPKLRAEASVVFKWPDAVLPPASEPQIPKAPASRPSSQRRVSTFSDTRFVHPQFNHFIFPFGTRSADSRVPLLECRSHLPKTQIHIKTRTTVPDEFKPLVAVLQRQRIGGVNRLLFSELGALLSVEQSPPTAIYKKAGTTQLKGYIAAAELHQVVSVRKDSRFGGTSIGATISLHPRFCTSPGSRT